MVIRFGNVPKVYYDLRSDGITPPPGIDEKKVIEALKSAGIAPAALRIRIVNKGKSPAKDIKIGSKTAGKFLYVNSNPPVSSKSVWVQVAIDSFQSGDNEAVVLIEDLVPEKKVVLDFGYEPIESTTESDVVASGIMAEKVADVDNVPQWTLLKALELPLQILLGGLFLSLLVGVVMAARSNPRLGDKIIDLLDAIMPMYSSILRIILK